MVDLCVNSLVRGKNMSEINVLYDGYSRIDEEGYMTANCTCTLIKGEHNIIVDTMTPWDSNKIIEALLKHNLTPEDIHYVVSTHGHSDHTGNNNLFLKAKHIVGFSISFQDKYYLHPFEKGEEYVVNENVKVIPTPGHTLSDVTVLVKNAEEETVAIAGDLFERKEDIENSNLWLEAGSEDPEQQRKNRLHVADAAHWIIPGHGPKFQVTSLVRELLKRQSNYVN